MATDSTQPTAPRNAPTGTSTSAHHIDHHPDIMSLRDRYAKVGDNAATGMLESLLMLAGLYLAISPWVAGFAGFTGLRVSNLVTGLALAVLGLGFGSALERTHNLGWGALAIGVWTIIAPWVVSGNYDTHKTIINNVILGGIICLLALATLGMGPMAKRMGRKQEAGGARR
ncbi:SPW repeat protein [Actinacidiphila sp. DG2A-62]|uniref:SPW repeat protein n=1 Tax=Actinacidiphila sp. DG2A-62 TaxID=3108821 RepID=UPI002DBC5B29|nr:SPW repeat protein [Actinacidiphila sp. DG2A-62]MEC3994834.1 SPW repeat protein [Actinacidiphila sp. DG2A-62]